MKIFHQNGLSALTLATALVGGIPVTSTAQNADIFAYDVHGRLIAIHRQDNKTTTYSIDPADNRQAKATYDQVSAAWQAESLPHVVGYAVAGGWGASAGTPAGFMTYGPYVTSVPVGMNVASWRIRVDSITYPDTLDVVTFDVWDTTAAASLGSLTVKRTEWVASDTYQDFEVPFALVSTSVGHPLEFRTLYHPSATVVVDQIGYRHSGGVWLAATELPHVIGYAGPNGWVADTSMSSGFMTYGPYGGVLPGARNGVWRIMVDNVSSPDVLPVVTLDIWDSTASQPVASVTLNRHAWTAANTLQDIRLPFVQDGSQAGHAMEFRTFYNGNAKVTVQWVGIE